MRFHRLALSTLAVLAVNSLKGFESFARADEVEDASETTNVAIEPVDSEKFEFQAEVSRVLDIVVNSLYQNKDVFLRELISNASDAIDKARFLAIQKPEVLTGKSELEVRISYDEDAGTLTVSDSGIGMTKADLIANLGTVAQSGTTKFMDALQEDSADVSQIGMFGVGFYSSYLVANKVTVASKHPDDPVQHIWTSSNGESSFNIGDDPRGDTLGRGTEITLHLKEDAEEYANFSRLQNLVNHYSEFIQHPIFLRKTEVMEVPDEDEEAEEEEKEGEDSDLDIGEEEDEFGEETEKEKKMKEVTTYSWEKANADMAIWNRPKDEITDDEYQGFYKLISKDYANATTWSHFDAEGNINFKSLVYVPTEVPQQLKHGNFEGHRSAVKLYVRKVLISDDFELLPKYLSFVQGVVDSDDLPLNVNRETLQESKIIKIVGKKVTRKVLEMIKKFSETDNEEEEAEAEIDEDGNIIEHEDDEEKEKKVHPYLSWYEDFAPSIKMGVMEDDANRSRLVKLLRIKTSKSNGEYISFSDYVERMKENQEEIYYIPGQSVEEVEESPFMDKFLEKDLEVIYMTDAADEYMIERMREFEGKKFSIITSEGVKLGDEDEDLEKRKHLAYEDKFGVLTKFLNKFYGKAVTKTQVSKRLGRIPAIVSSGSYGHSANMEKIIRAQVYSHGQDENMVRGMRTLEINPRHPFMESLLEEIPEDPKDTPQKLKDFLWSLLDTALLSGGFTINNGKTFSTRMIRMLQSDLDIDSLDLLPEIEPKEIEEDDAPDAVFDSPDGFGDIDLDAFSDSLDTEDF